MTSPANPIIFVTGIGTGIGKTLVSALLVEALQADYWKPVQAGYAEGTDSEWVAAAIGNPYSKIYPEAYRLALPASPHIAAREEGLEISLDHIASQLQSINRDRTQRQAHARPLIVEGAGGLLVPLNDRDFVADLAVRLGGRVVLVSRNYLGSINHSLLTAREARRQGLDLAGWIFNDQYLDYEEEIVRWTALRRILSIPRTENPSAGFVQTQARGAGSRIRDCLA